MASEVAIRDHISIMHMDILIIEVRFDLRGCLEGVVDSEAIIRDHISNIHKDIFSLISNLRPDLASNACSIGPLPSCYHRRSRMVNMWFGGSGREEGRGKRQPRDIYPSL